MGGALYGKTCSPSALVLDTTEIGHRRPRLCPETVISLINSTLKLDKKGDYPANAASWKGGALHSFSTPGHDGPVVSCLKFGQNEILHKIYL
jgi:hypothetical protein